MALDGLLQELDVESSLWFNFTITDTAYGTVSFRGSDLAVVTTGYGPIVKSWGAIRTKMRGMDTRSGVSETVIELYADAKMPMIGTVVHALPDPWSIREVLKNLNVRGAILTIYQTEHKSGDYGEIWRGSITGVRTYRDEDGVAVCTLVAKQYAKGQDVFALTPVARDLSVVPGYPTWLYPNATEDVKVKFIPRSFGDFGHTLNGSHAWFIYFGYRPRGVQGIPVDPKITDGRTRYVFHEASGIDNHPNTGRAGTMDNGYGMQGVGEFITGGGLLAPVVSTTDASTTNREKESTFVVYLADSNLYGVMTATDFTTDRAGNFQHHDGSEDLCLDIGDKGYNARAKFGVRPTTLMESHTSAAWRGELAMNVVDDDPTNYLDCDGTNYDLSFECPSISVPSGGSVYRIMPILEYETTTAVAGRTAEFGFWNEANNYGSVTPDWLTLSGTTCVSTMTFPNDVGFHRFYPSTKWATADYARANADGRTDDQFRSGQFGGSVSGAYFPYEIRFHMTSGTKTGIRLRHVGFVAWINLATDVLTRPTAYIPIPVPPAGQVTYEKDGILYDSKGSPIGRRGFTGVTSSTTVQPTGGTVILNVGQFEYDIIGGPKYCETGSDAALIEKAASVAFLLAEHHAGASVNVSAGTLGCVTDAIDEDTTGFSKLAISFGPDKQYSVTDCFAEMTARWPIAIDYFDNKYNIRNRYPNPTINQMYTKTISARRHILRGTLQVQEPEWGLTMNQQKIGYCCSGATTEFQKSVTSDHYLSQYFFGVLPAPLEVEPWITGRFSTTATVEPPAQFLANFLAYNRAMPRLEVRVVLTTAFHDIRPGHVVEFDADLDPIMPCPAFRCGRLDVLSPYATGYPNAFVRSDDPTPEVLVSGTHSGEITLGANYQFSSFTIDKPTGGAYTTVTDAWEYLNTNDVWTTIAMECVNSAGAVIDANTVFKAAAGKYTLTWGRPNSPSYWPKKVVTLNGAKAGPSYLMRMKYTSSTEAYSLNDFIRPADTWAGRLFEVVEVARTMTGKGVKKYPAVGVLMKEVM